MKKIVYFLVFSTLLIACNEKNDAIEQSYYGLLPCADCPGIEYEIKFNKDNTFNESMLYLDRDAKPWAEIGTYTLENDSIIVVDRVDNEGFTHFLLKEDNQLVILDKERKEVEGALADFYILSTEKVENTELMSEPISEYSFQANGNEPFWNIRFGEDDKMYLRGMLGEHTVNYSFPTPEAKEINEHAKSYYVKNNDLEMELLVSPEPCDDTMADYSYTHKVALHLKLADWNEFQDLEGCGEFAGIYQLNNIWKLESINGEKVSENNRKAHLQFNINEGTFYGNGGCNNLNGKVELKDTSLTFSKVATTMMACENLEEESKFITKLDEQTYDILLSKNDLTLKNDENELVFKRLE